MGLWEAISRLFFGFRKAKSLTDLAEMCKTPEELRDYAKQHFLYKKRQLDIVNWTTPERSFQTLHDPDDNVIVDSVDCDEAATVFWWVLNKNGYEARLVFVACTEAAHAICVYQADNTWRYLDSFCRPVWRFNSITDVLKDVFSKPKVAYFMSWNGKKFMRGEDIKL